ncbi:hypothetical protein CPB86DRAFT_788480 [Serendipita vermifera]|nr:hypothetical protein CPB86DRAFT_788480 [Serendipita vermifera]
MNVFLRAFKVHRRKPSIVPPVISPEKEETQGSQESQKFQESQESQESQELLPSLPIELWFIILKMVVRPNLILDLEFEPYQIQLAIFTLADRFYGGEAAARRMIAMSKRLLRPVCRAWKEIVDNLEDMDECVDEKYYHNDKKRPNTSRCEKLHLEYSLDRDASIKVRYSHPVPTVSLKVISHPEGPVVIKSLDNLIPFTDYLHIFDLELGNCDASNGILGDIQMRMVPLTTLRLTLDRFEPLFTPLEIPTLKNLFLSIPEYDESRWARPPSTFQWRFLELRALSLVEKGSNSNTYAWDMHPFLMDILRNHFEKIQALLINPMPRELADQKSPLCWTNMPNLQSFGTDFYPKGKLPDDKHGETTPTLTKSSSVRHLIVSRTLMEYTDDILSGLKVYIRACYNVRCIYFAGGGYQSNIGWDTDALRRLQRLCKHNGIILKDLYDHTAPRRDDC